jgi:hypothetical protein
MQRRCLMHIARSRAFRLVMIVGGALTAASCSKDDIPTTPSSPFFFTDVAISKFVSPPATNALHPSVAYVTRFAVNYTLAPDIDANRSQYGVFAEVNSYDANFNYLATLGTIAFTPQVLAGPSGAVSDSIAFTVPASGASYIFIEAGIGLRTSGTFSGGRFGPYWSVK